eukprot:1176872-Prorocentrum_minimum.AAC.3
MDSESPAHDGGMHRDLQMCRYDFYAYYATVMLFQPTNTMTSHYCVAVRRSGHGEEIRCVCARAA